MAEFPSIQGRFPSWASVTLKLGNVTHTLVTSLKWDESLTPTKVYAQGSKAKGGTRGKHEANGSMEMLLPGWKEFRKALADVQANRSYGLTEFEIDAAWRETDLDPVHTAHISRVRIMKVARDNAEGPDPTKISLDLFIIGGVDEDGDSLLSSNDG